VSCLQAAAPTSRMIRMTGIYPSWKPVLDTIAEAAHPALFADSARTLTFPSPCLKQHPTVHRRSGRGGTTNSTRTSESYDESFRRELSHFHDCIAAGLERRKPPEQARLDIDVLTKMFNAAHGPS